MTNNYRQKTTQAARYQEHRSDWATTICDDPWPIHFSAQTSLPKGSQNQNIIVMKPALISPLQKKERKKGGLVLPAKGQLHRININTIPGGERKEEKRDLASIHIPPATIFFRAAGISSIPATKALPPGWREGGRRPPAALWIRSKCSILWQGADKILCFPKRIEASLFSPVP